MKKIAFYNHKGGVGKTTSVINVAYFLQKKGFKTLVVDCDSQKNCLGFFAAHTKLENLFCTSFKQYFQPDLSENYEYILFDLPPAMTDEVKEIIKISDLVYVPVKLGAYEIKGLTDVTNEIQKQGTKLGGVFVTMFRNGNKSDITNLENVKKILNKTLIKTVIPNSDAVMNSQIEEMFIEEYLDFKRLPNTPTQRKIVTAYENLTQKIIDGGDKK
ncbi:copy number control protein [Clostridia bacterium]|nr:copy number control protein [Clostridia bacterium]